MSMDLGCKRLSGAGSLAVLVLVAGCTVASAAGADKAFAEAGRPAWPMFNGPFGNFVPRDYGADLVDDLADARLLWVSEESDIGVAKGPYSVERILAAGASPHPGGRSSPIVADGTVFVAYYRPVGPPYATDAIRILGRKAERPESWADIWGIEAHDVVVAIDAATGRTKWKAVEQRAGVRIPSLKRGDWGVSPAYHDGKVYSLGTTARLRCYDAETGERIWDRPFGKTHQWAAAEKARALEEGRFVDNLGGWLSSLVVAENVLIVPTFRGHPQGIAGVSLENGEILWEREKVLSKFATPAVVRQDGREYLLANSGRGELRLIDPRSGEVLWTVDNLGPYLGSLSPSDTHVIVNTRANPQREKSVNGLWGAYRFDPDGAELAWQLPDKPKYEVSWHLDSGPRRKVVIHDGVAYIGNRSSKPERNLSLYVVDVESGKILQEIAPAEDSLEGEGFNSPLAMEDRLLTFYDQTHGTRGFGGTLFDVREDGTLERLSRDDEFPHSATTAYEVPIETPYVDGRIFFRTEDGTIVCYDLRQQGQATE